MKKCIFCTAELKDNEIKCSYCGKEQSVQNNIVDEQNTMFTNDSYSNEDSSSYNKTTT